jgi:hypothetical protein
VKKRLIIATICAVSLTVPVFGAPKVDMDSYEKDGKKYIEKTYVIDVDEDISDVADGTFELDGYAYSQIDIKSEAIVETEEKEVEQLEKASVAAQGAQEIYKTIGETIEYADEDGFHGELKPDLENVKYYASGYTYKTMTKNGSQMYYNLSSMDISQIPKSIWRDGIQLKLMDVQWIGDNRSASADTAVGNNFAAKGIYQGTYQVNIPSGYTAEVLYKGTVEKEIAEQTAYKVTYVGEEVDPVFFDNVSVPYLIGFVLFDAAVIAAAVILVKKLRKKNQESDEEEEQENDEKEGGTDED